MFPFLKFLIHLGNSNLFHAEVLSERGRKHGILWCILTFLFLSGKNISDMNLLLRTCFLFREPQGKVKVLVCRETWNLSTSHLN